MIDTLKRKLVWVVLMALVMQFYTTNVYAQTANPNDVVINEVAWAGSTDSSSDEWIELYNNTSSPIDLTGWTIEDDIDTVYTIESGTIESKNFFLIEDSEDVTSIQSDAVIALSFANTGDSLVLKDDSGNVIDTVNGSGSAWFAGDSASNATMERMDPKNSVDSADNWASALSGNGALASAGSSILGTPGSVNSTYSGSGPSIELNPSNPNPAAGETITITADVSGMDDIYSYGVELLYDPTVLDFVSATEGSVLNSDGESTFFSAALENGVEGSLIVANSRLASPPQGIDASGTLFTMTFDVIGIDSDLTNITFAASSFISDSSGDVPASLEMTTITVTSTSVDPVTDLQAGEGTDRYSIELTWSAPSTGADSYLVYRIGADGSSLQIGEVTDTTFLDQDGVTNGGNIVPHNQYEYRVVSQKNGNQSSAEIAFGTDTRGLKGDNDRSDRVDGRDLDRLARAYGSAYGDPNYDPLLDTTYDGIIDGSDLIDIGANFAITY